MKLAEALRAMAPILAGRVTPDEGARALGAAPAGIALYARLARGARSSLLEGMFPHCRHAIVALLGEEGWRAIVEAYFEANIELRFVRHANAGAFPAFVSARDALPPWIGEVADLEWHEWQAEIGPRAPSDDDPDRGPLRVTTTLVLRRYAHDLVTWIDDADRAGAPSSEAIHCAFWQDRDAVSFRNALSEAHVTALEAVRAGGPIEPSLQDELRSADLLLGS